MPAKRNTQPKDASSATIGFEAKLWLAADKLRNNMDAAEGQGFMAATWQRSNSVARRKPGKIPGGG